MKNITAKIKHHLHLSEKKRLFKKVLKAFERNLPKGDFCFDGWEIDYPVIRFNYSQGNKQYTCQLTLHDIPREKFAILSQDVLDILLSLIGLSFLPRHFSLGDFDQVLSRVPLPLTVKDFYSKVFYKSLAENRYRNGMNPAKTVSFISDDFQEAASQLASQYIKEGTLILNGAGKDTVVAIEQCKTLGTKLGLLSINLENGVNMRAQQDRLADIAGIDSCYHMSIRYSDELYRNMAIEMEGLPYLLSFSLLGVIPALVDGWSAITCGDEYSANFGNVFSQGIDINHQYDKSFEFEKSLNALIKELFSNRLDVYSILRPYHDIQLAYFLSRHPAYFQDVISCNINPTSWCRQCPKCAFTYLAFAAFIERDAVLKIFGENLLERQIIRREIVDLTSSKLKPWDCVGTPEECQLILRMVLDKYPALEFDTWPKRKDLEKYCKEVNVAVRSAGFLNFYNQENLIPPHVKQVISTAYLDACQYTS